MTLTGISDDGFRIGVLQSGNKAYHEMELGDSHNLREVVSALLNIHYRNDDYNDVAGALQAAIDMFHTRYWYYLKLGSCIV